MNYIYKMSGHCFLVIRLLTQTLHGDIDQTLGNSLHGPLNCEIGELGRPVITTEYRTSVYCIHMQHLFCNVLVHVIYSVSFRSISVYNNN